MDLCGGSCILSGCPDENPDRKRRDSDEAGEPDHCAQDRDTKVEDGDIDQPRDNRKERRASGPPVRDIEIDRKSG